MRFGSAAEGRAEDETESAELGIDDFQHSRES